MSQHVEQVVLFGVYDFLHLGQLVFAEPFFSQPSSAVTRWQ
jgi:hypothetical protein